MDAVRTRQPDINALFMSGYAADIIDEKGALDEGLHFMPKPVTPFELLGMVRTVLDAGNRVP